MLYNNLRLSSGLVLFAFVLCHLINHAFGLHSVTAMSDAKQILLGPWLSPFGEGLLLAAVVTHSSMALYSLYQRRSLRMSRWEKTQLAMGLLIPIFLVEHVVATGVAEELHGIDPNYFAVLGAFFVTAPFKGVLQFIATLIVWIHACIGLHYWLRTKPFYPVWRRWLGLLAVVIPTMSLSGYIAGGLEVRGNALLPGYVDQIMAMTKVTEEKAEAIYELAGNARGYVLLVILLPFAARFARHLAQRVRHQPRLTLPDGRSFRITPGASVLEVLRDNDIQHAAVCGGKGRCTTCRVRLLSNGDKLAPPEEVEARALNRIHALEGVRLACQLHPAEDLSIAPLLPPNATARDGRRPGGLEGREVEVACMFIDLRGSTKLGENKLPYDVLFILNQFFAEMTLALEETGGHYAQFNGDGLMALYGLQGKDSARAVRNAVKGAKRMLERLDSLNEQLSSELPEPLKMGIGIHFGEAIVGPMGPPANQLITAIGDNINLTARLESLTKEYGVPLILSNAAAGAGGIDISGGEEHQVTVRGKSQPVTFQALQSVPSM